MSLLLQQLDSGMGDGEVYAAAGRELLETGRADHGLQGDPAIDEHPGLEIGTQIDDLLDGACHQYSHHHSGNAAPQDEKIFLKVLQIVFLGRQVKIRICCGWVKAKRDHKSKSKS